MLPIVKKKNITRNPIIVRQSLTVKDCRFFFFDIYLSPIFTLVGFLILQVGRYFPAPQAFKLHAFLARQ